MGENEETKTRYATENKRKNAARYTVPKYNVKKGTKLPLYADGWTDHKETGSQCVSYPVLDGRRPDGSTRKTDRRLCPLSECLPSPS